MTRTLTSKRRTIKIFTPSFADQENTNAQNLTVKEIVSRLPPELFSVTMICRKDPDPRIAARSNTKLLRCYRHGNALYWLAQVMLSMPDVYFYPRQGPLDRAFLALRKTLRLKTALVTHIAMVMNDSTASGMTKRSIVQADAVFGNSAYVAETIRRKYGVPARTMYNGIDRRYFFPAPAARNVDSLTVLYAGSFQARKRAELIVREAARRAHVSFRLAGRGGTESACRELAARLGSRNVTFLGHLSPAQLGEEMRRANIFLFPSILEGHPQVLGQAAASGLPAIAMNVYRPEYVVNGRSGFLVESDAELSEKLDLLLADAGLRQSMSAAAVQHAMRFDWDSIAAQWAQVFQEVARR